MEQVVVREDIPVEHLVPDVEGCEHVPALDRLDRLVAHRSDRRFLVLTTRRQRSEVWF